MQKNVIQNDLHTQVPRLKSEDESRRKKDDVMVRDKRRREGGKLTPGHQSGTAARAE